MTAARKRNMGGEVDVEARAGWRSTAGELQAERIAHNLTRELLTSARQGATEARNDRERAVLERNRAERELAESRSEVDRLRALLSECVEPIAWAEEQTYSEFSDYAKSEKFGEIHERVIAALSLEPNP